MTLKIIAALIAIESGGDRLAVGDGGKAVGILQIHPIMVAEANRLLGYEEFALCDRLDVRRSVDLAYVVLTERVRRRELQRPFTCDIERIRYMAGIWNNGTEYADKVLSRLQPRHIGD